MSSNQNSSKIEDLIFNIIGGTVGNLLPILVLGILAFFGRFLRAAVHEILLATTGLICAGIIMITIRRRAQLKRAISLIVVTIMMCVISISTEFWCSDEPVHFIVTNERDNQGYIVKNERIQIKQDEQLAIKLVANSKIERKEALGNEFICKWESSDRARIAAIDGCLIWFNTNVAPGTPTNHATVEVRQVSCSRREQKVLAIDLSQ